MGIHPIFPLPIFLDEAEGSEYTDIQKELTDTKHTLKFNDSGSYMILNENPFNSNFLIESGCHHSIKFINKTVDKFVTSLYGEYDKDIFKWAIIESWMTKTIKGRCAREHSHGSYDISGVYYLDTNGNDGNLIFTNINHNLEGNMLLNKLLINGDVAMPLKNGTIFLWPGQLRHKTLINETDHERISISFNITISKKVFRD
tara:strand:+ start:2067 stop:2669 length:603 start_codon:yes stop_codon:yes gene_type:complete